jgi:hypothetical protein
MRRRRSCPASRSRGRSNFESGVDDNAGRVDGRRGGGGAADGTIPRSWRSAPSCARSTRASPSPGRRAGPQLSGTAGVNQDLTQTGGGTGRNVSASVNVSLSPVQRRSRPQFDPRRRRAGAGGPSQSQGDRGRHLHRGGRRLHGRDPRPLDRQLNQNQVRVLETNLQATATASRSATSPAPTSPSPRRGSRWRAKRTSPPPRAGSGSEENYRRVIGELPDELRRRRRCRRSRRRRPGGRDRARQQ